MNDNDYVSAMLQSYAETALWSSPNDRYELGEVYGEMMDADFDVDDISAGTMRDMWNDCRDFYRRNRADLADMDPGEAGHLFWLTRNRHGVGFWDRGLGDKGDRLTSAAHAYGESTLYVGDDGMVYAS